MGKAAPIELVHSYTTPDGYSFLAFAKGKGRNRVYWWHCGGCWEDCADVPVLDMESLGAEFVQHGWLCPSRLTETATVVLRRPEGCVCPPQQHARGAHP